jgi:para-aminobenzoate synthetase component I
MHLKDFTDKLNELGRKKIPFLFLVDFEMRKPKVWLMDQVSTDEMLYSINGFSNAPVTGINKRPTQIIKHPVPFDEYEKKFNAVYHHLSYGNSFLVNLTIKTNIEINCTLKNLFYHSTAKYKCWLKNEFLFFSPEIFIQIRNGKIYSYPMKGTMDASLRNAKQLIIENKKELAEHVTITDLIRNDLSQIASNVSIARFRFIDEIVAYDKKLLQVSSEIVGDLPPDYQSLLGNIIISLLPAGSVSGAPKSKTCEIIKSAEGDERGYYTGIFGYFDGENLDSGVAIRFIEQQGSDYFYRSGGGITAQSLVRDEYREAIDKIYVPVI